MISESIGAIKGISYGVSGGSNAITEQTRKKLEALGIDPKTVKSEKEAQEKIKEAESAQANASVNQPDSKQNHSMQKVILDAKDLAQNLGVSYSEQMPVKDLLDNIKHKIDKANKAVEGDENNKEIIAGYQQDYDKIYSNYMSAQSSSDKFMNNLSMLATYNKIGRAHV